MGLFKRGYKEVEKEKKESLIYGECFYLKTGMKLISDF